MSFVSTLNYFKKYNKDFLGDISKKSFSLKKRVKISELEANQPELDYEWLQEKIKGKELTEVYVLNFNSRLIVIDGHHTTVSKKINGQTYLYANYYELEEN